MNSRMFLGNEEQMNKMSNDFGELYKKLERQFFWIPFEGQEPEMRIKSLFFACAICNNMNWEFLCNVVIPKLRAETNEFRLDRLRALRVETMENFFSEYDKPYKVEADRRLRVLVALAGELEKERNSFFKELLQSTVLKGNTGFLTKVVKFSVFNEDPLRKKANLLAQLAISSGLIRVSDEYELEPTIDYHVMRVYLRTGRVIVGRQGTAKPVLDEATELRKSIAGVAKQFCIRHNISLIQLGFIDWIIGREFCSPETPNCNACPISKACTSAGLEARDMLLEPKSDQGFY